jgi:hypothetical protein
MSPDPLTRRAETSRELGSLACQPSLTLPTVVKVVVEAIVEAVNEAMVIAMET